MYGKYVWFSGASAANIVSDLVALITGADIASLSVACNKPLTTKLGSTPGWTVVDAAYGVVGRAHVVGGVSNKQARITCTTAVQLAIVEDWNASTHVAANAVPAAVCGLGIAGVGAVNYLFTPDFLLIAASDWTKWQAGYEIKRDGPVLIDNSVPAHFQLGESASTFIRIKAPTAIGDLFNGAMTVQSAYGTLVAASVRDRGEALYIPMVPAIGVAANVPIGEAYSLMVAGGYGLSGDYMLDQTNANYLIVKQGGTLFAFPRS